MPTGARLARTSDTDAIADVQVRAWRARFAGLLPDEVLSGLDARDIADAWGSSIVRPPTPGHRVLVAIDGDRGDRVVGYAALGPDSSQIAGTGELFDLVIDPSATGQGHGSRLMQAAIDHLRGAGLVTVHLWIPLEDAARRSFLESAGWGPDGAFRDIDVSGTVVREVRFVTDIGTDPVG